MIGAGRAGQLLCRDVKSTVNMKEQIVAFIDDNRNKRERDIDGVPVLGANYILGTTSQPVEISILLRICETG